MALPLPPGAPSLLRPPTTIAGITNATNTLTLLRADVALVRRLFEQSKWGIFKDGSRVITPDSITSFGYRQDTRISDYPLEDGDFETYNKVGTPFEVRVRMTKGGSDADRAGFLKSCEALVNSFDLFEVSTPEKTYTRANVQRYDYERTATNGVGLLSVDLYLIEVRNFAKTAFVKTAKPAGAAPVNTGLVRSAPVTQAVTNFVGRINTPPAITNFVGVFK